MPAPSRHVAPPQEAQTTQQPQNRAVPKASRRKNEGDKQSGTAATQPPEGERKSPEQHQKEAREKKEVENREPAEPKPGEEVPVPDERSPKKEPDSQP